MLPGRRRFRPTAPLRWTSTRRTPRWPTTRSTPDVAGVPLPLTRGTSGTVAGQAGGALVRRTVLPGGVRVLTESVPGVRSVTLGCWVGVGSRDEAPGYLGATHFLEHLLF